MKDVSGAVVLITGAAMGMGRLFAERAVAERAAAVVLLDINEEALAVTAGELSGGTTLVHTEVVDVRRVTALRAAARRIRKAVGALDIVINNAGIVRGNAYFWETDPVADTQLTIEVNTVAPMLVAREFLPEMIEGGRPARLVNICLLYTSDAADE